MAASNSTDVHEKHSGPTTLSDFILGWQDGLVNILGIVLGVSAATSDIRILFVATLAAVGAASISMGAVAYTSTSARRRHYLKEVEQEKKEMREVPEIERKEVEDVFKEWGYTGKKLKEMTDGICSNDKAWLEFMMAHELKLGPIAKGAATTSFITVTLATLLGSIIPIIPFIFLPHNMPAGVEWSIVLSAITLFIVGFYEAKITVGSLWISGLRMVAIGLTAGFAGYLIGHFLGAAPL